MQKSILARGARSGRYLPSSTPKGFSFLACAFVSTFPAKFQLRYNFGQDEVCRVILCFASPVQRGVKYSEARNHSDALTEFKRVYA